MPIYEFYCSDCNTLFNFFSQRIDTEALPGCPRCPRPHLERRPARFAMLRHAGQDEPPTPFDDLDDDRFDDAMGSLLEEMEGLDESEDPRAMAHMMKRFGEISGLEMGPQMAEMVGRLEAGEDPDALEEDFADVDDDAMDEFFRLKKRAQAWASRKPRVDDNLYFL